MVINNHSIDAAQSRDLRLGCLPCSIKIGTPPPPPKCRLARLGGTTSPSPSFLPHSLERCLVSLPLHPLRPAPVHPIPRALAPRPSRPSSLSAMPTSTLAALLHPQTLPLLDPPTLVPAAPRKNRPHHLACPTQPCRESVSVSVAATDREGAFLEFRRWRGEVSTSGRASFWSERMEERRALGLCRLDAHAGSSTATRRDGPRGADHVLLS